MLISPRNTFSNSGISSKLVKRRNLPKVVNLSASGRGFPHSSTSFVMLLNLSISNGTPQTRSPLTK